MVADGAPSAGAASAIGVAVERDSFPGEAEPVMTLEAVVTTMAGIIAFVRAVGIAGDGAEAAVAVGDFPIVPTLSVNGGVVALDAVPSAVVFWATSLISCPAVFDRSASSS
jgi:hypothetical protein